MTRVALEARGLTKSYRIGKNLQPVLQIVPEADPSTKAMGRVIRIAATLGARKLKSDTANEASDERVVEVVVSVENASFLIGQRVLVKFLQR